MLRTLFAYLSWGIDRDMMMDAGFCFLAICTILWGCCLISSEEQEKQRTDTGCYAPELLSVTSRGRRLMPVYRYRCDSGREYEADTLLR